MKYILFLFLLSLGSLYACEGDCVLCHPKLVKEDGKLDKDHAVLTTCKTCHTQEEMAKIDMGSGCGQDCWECHDIQKVTRSHVPQHQGLQKCIDCHVTLDKNLFGGGSVEPFSATPSLDDLLSQGESQAPKDLKMIEEVTIELNETNITAPTSTTKEASHLGFWERLLDFLHNLWQKLLNIFN